MCDRKGMLCVYVYPYLYRDVDARTHGIAISMFIFESISMQ